MRQAKVRHQACLWRQSGAPSPWPSPIGWEREADNFTQPELMWKVMALATMFAGNLTILGSVANVIVIESARGHVEVGFWDYARFGIPVSVLTTVIGMVILLLLG